MTPTNSELSALDRLRLYLRPVGQGIPSAVATKLSANVTSQIYGSGDLAHAWEDSLQKIRRVQGLIVGFPSDAGSGVFRGAAFGPTAIREAFLAQFHHVPKGWLDVGDVFCVPELLDDEMLSDAQLLRCRKIFYPGIRKPLPVSPLSLLEEALRAVLELNPALKLVTLGGDQSLALPLVRALASLDAGPLGVLHIDPFCDLQETRFGIAQTNTSWAFHAISQLRKQALVQVGTRHSSHPKAYWMEELPVLQLWQEEIETREKEVIGQIVEHFVARGFQRLYVSVDLRALEAFGERAGAPTRALSPSFLVALVRALREELDVVGADLCELVPSLSPQVEFRSDRTCLSAAHLLNVLLDAIQPSKP